MNAESSAASPSRWKTWTRDPNPILVKEFRTIFRSKLFIRFLYLSVLAVAALVVLFCATVADSGSNPGEAGRIIYQVFFSLALSVISIVAPAQGAMSITTEREGRTYESLLLTGMSAGRIVRGKFLAVYGSLLLVLIALSPIVGLAFLFGGVSPTHVLFAFLGLAIALAPAVAYGIAISAHVSSTRMALLAAVFTWPPAAMMGTGLWTALGEELKRTWNLTNEGPFWFGEALGERFFELDTFFGAGVGPLYLSGIILWFCLAAAISGVRPPAEDRSGPLKRWSLAALVGPMVLFFVLPFAFPSSARDAAESGLVLLAMGGFFIFFLCLVFVNEPPLPPRAVQPGRGPLRQALYDWFGPGARPTMRFASLLVVLAPFLFALCSAAGRHIAHPGASRTTRADLGMLALSAGMAAVAFFLVTFGTMLRIRTRRGVLARGLVFAVFVAGLLGPLLITAIVDPRGFNNLDDNAPLLVMLSPLMPIVSGFAAYGNDDSGHPLFLLPCLILYGALGAWCYYRASSSVSSIVAHVESVRAQHAARTSAPPHVPGVSLRESIPSPPEPVPPAPGPSTHADVDADASAPGEGDSAAASSPPSQPADVPATDSEA